MMGFSPGFPSDFTGVSPGFSTSLDVVGAEGASWLPFNAACKSATMLAKSPFVAGAAACSGVNAVEAPGAGEVACTATGV